MKRLFVIALITALTAALIFPVMADNDSIKDKMSEIDDKLDNISKQKSEIRKEKDKLESEKKELINAENTVNAEYQDLVSELEALDREIASYEDSLKDTEERYGKHIEAFEERLVAMYKNSYVSYLDVLADSENLINFFERLEIISSVAKKDKEIVKEVQDIKKDLTYKQQLVQYVKNVKQTELIKKKNSIDSLIASRNGLENRIKERNEEIKRLEEQEDKLIEQSCQIADQIRRSAKGGKNYAGGTMVWPVPSSKTIDSGYGMRLHPVFKKYKMHTGVDIDASYGASIVAANNGIVIFSGWQDGYGYTVIVDHGGGITTLYAHCSKLLVNNGDKVRKGQTIAQAGSTGTSTGTHLHFEVRIDGNVTNPLDYIK
ncbi:murein hydrolase activator EnvC family protein [Acetivibrio mesophilus]|uniref:Peptidase M23 n=1 Tax=Acetivibrio mesophilus TaxID=2487273 RepID=A0A4V1K1X9_9FIRM|nr:peptidoglycan DD-metalloendopeptidase family protein [Acetivibrio mesophilus]ODM25422.1 peptidase M23 [Clostridium sp. Bc-iso-3]RXE58349.1 peptidase M23 [Acetivibrio mesophilus]HHV28906.1 peptidoglycan DD-metalloendopeptidase family protein [Clostridium sp.]